VFLILRSVVSKDVILRHLSRGSATISICVAEDMSSQFVCDITVDIVK
jgi:hypothetical protein